MTAHQKYLATRHFGSLDGVRALSILGVIWFHTIVGPGSFGWENHGYLGVDMFFVLSGFLITTLLLREEGKHGTISLPKFYMRRSLRIFPIYFGLLAALAIAFGVMGSERPMTERYFYALPFLATYTSNWMYTDTIMNISWTLAAEEQFYVFWPPARKFLGRFAWLLVGLVMLVSELVNFRVLHPWLASTFGEDFLLLPMVSHTFTPICLGVFVAGALHFEKGFALLHRVAGSRATPAVAAILFALLLATAPSDMAGWPKLGLYLLMTFFLAGCVMREDHWLAPVLQFSWLSRIGVLSYGIYLYHMLVLHALGAVGVPFGPLLLVLGTIASWLVAEVSYRTVERFFLGLKSRYAT